ncbi:MAG: sulfatase-like hydrolase/transferase [Pseudomonadota bacterium]
MIEAGPCARSLQIDYDDEVEFHAQRWLFDQARKKDRQPFFLTVSFTSPHDPYVAQRKFWDIYRTEDIDLPEVGPIPADERDAHSARIHEHYSIGKAEVTNEILLRARHGYYASISYIDRKVENLMRTLQEAGLDRNTIVVFASDHGDMMGERGLFYKKSFFEWSVRVPLIFWAPNLFGPARMSAPVSLLDILPTFHDFAGGPPDEVLDADGASLLPVLNGADSRDRIVPGEFLAEGVFEPTFMLRDDRYKLFYSEIDPPLLFDMVEDPHELDNLAEDPRHARKLEQFCSHGSDLSNASDIRKTIIADQNRRRLIDRAHKMGKPPVWDYQPIVDASQSWVRAGKWTVEVEAGAHFDMTD